MVDKIGDKVDFFDWLGKKFVGTIEKINAGKNTTATISASRKKGSTQSFLSVTKSTNKKTKPRWDSVVSKETAPKQEQTETIKK